jgi:hypothetical protein
MHRRWRDVPGGEHIKGMFPAASAEAVDDAEENPVEPERTS